jgi:type II secretory pathway component GspD/PulD (secretin)
MFAFLIRNFKTAICKNYLKVVLLFLPLLTIESEEKKESLCTIHFTDVAMGEFVRYVSKVCGVNFMFDHQDLQFKITFSTGKSVPTSEVLNALMQMLRSRGFLIAKENDYYVVQRSSEYSFDPKEIQEFALDSQRLTASLKPNFSPLSSGIKFSVYKLQYHLGSEIEESIKQIGVDLRNQPTPPLQLLQAIQTLHWVKATNSLLYSGDPASLLHLKELIMSLDVPRKQVFIEVLVIETSVKKMMDFGLQWGAGGKYRDSLSFGMSNTAPGGNAFSENLQQTTPSNPPSGFGQIPILEGFDIGVIGNIIMHKGKSYLSLGSLVSALQLDGDSTIVLNQKIVTQDNKKSTIFVGENIPFTGSVVQTIGQGQQTTANIEYRDVGVNLNITPMLGEGDVITLDLNEEISEAHNDPFLSSREVSGIRTSKTNMSTQVHVPDKHFLVLSGMIRNTKTHHKSGIPILSKIPLLGVLFSRTEKKDEKRNVIIFVRPHIIKRVSDYDRLSEKQCEIYQKQSHASDFQEGVDLLQSKSEEKKEASL